MKMYLLEASPDETTEVYCTCSAATLIHYEPVGRFYEAAVKRLRNEKSISLEEEEGENEKEAIEKDEECKELTFDEKQYLLTLDSAEWKKQDHYKVLRIPHLRAKATDDDIKRAYRRMVLKYHPDKRKAEGALDIPKEVNLHEYFTCITKAFEQLSTLEGRQAFDSVDPTFDETTPSTYSSSKQDFFRTFQVVFERNSRWSNEQPAPLLGDMDESIDDVDNFYTFWFEFSSWRNYSYEDEEETDKAESREERRWMERENKSKRTKRKKEEMKRIKNFVELAYQNDPRIKKHRDDEKKRKEQKKKAREDAAAEEKRKRQEQLETERKQKEQAELEAKEKAQKEKKEKDKMKKAAARDRKAIRQFVKGENHFGLDKDELTSLERLEKSLENLSIEDLQTLKGLVDKKDKQSFKKSYSEMSGEVLKKLKAVEDERKQSEINKTQNAKQSQSSQSSSENKWSELELQLLVKATTLYPIGTASIWDVIADYINEHGQNEGNTKNSKQVINKVKSLKKQDAKLKEEVNQKAFSALEKTTNAKQNAKSAQNIQSDATVNNDKIGGPEQAAKPWSSDEQRLLEQALKTYDAKTAERWEKIALAVPSRTKKECMKRYKELVEMIKAKKKAAAQG